jgi:hypothetical protein
MLELLALDIASRTLRFALFSCVSAWITSALATRPTLYWFVVSCSDRS